MVVDIRTKVLMTKVRKSNMSTTTKGIEATKGISNGDPKVIGSINKAAIGITTTIKEAIGGTIILGIKEIGAGTTIGTTTMVVKVIGGKAIKGSQCINSPITRLRSNLKGRVRRVMT